MAPRTVGKPRGILHRAPSHGRSEHRRWAPPDDLAPFVEHFWAVRWDLPEPFLQETLPHPSVHVVVENGQARVVGVVRGRFSRVLEGEGRVFGVKFRPGGFYPFVGWPVSRIVNRVVPLREVFGKGSEALAPAVVAQAGEDGMSEVAAAFLRARLPERDLAAEETGRLVERIAADRAVTRVEHLVSGLDWSTRRLQRQFSRYVGVGPKWVIQRYRLHEAVESIKAGAVVDWPQLALDLGYFDQAHFIRDFKALVGRPPAEYARLVR
jgi:AraC-like DNA-binding protein